MLTSAAAPVLLIGGWTLAAGLRPDRFDSVKDTISDLAAVDAPNRWVMTAALVGVELAAQHHLGGAARLALVEIQEFPATQGEADVEGERQIVARRIIGAGG